jgi:thioredoxin-dependent peroxiredoxin
MNALHRVPKKGLKTTEMLAKPVLDFAYVYPKENTPGRSADGARRRPGAKEKIRFPFELLSDSDEALCKQFAVMKELIYGKKVRGIERSTYVVDAQGVLAREWRGVKVPGHAQEVLNFAKAL